MLAWCKCSSNSKTSDAANEKSRSRRDQENETLVKETHFGNADDPNQHSTSVIFGGTKNSNSLVKTTTAYSKVVRTESEEEDNADPGLYEGVYKTTVIKNKRRKSISLKGIIQKHARNSIKFDDYEIHMHQQCLFAHNRYRLKHGMKPLTLNKELCQYATAWAKHLAKKNILQYRKKNKYGENIALGTQGMYTPEHAVKSWYDEIENYDFKKPGFTSNTGHFSQVIWQDTTQLGVGVAQTDNLTWVVCNYNPPGNIINQYEKNVVEPKGGTLPRSKKLSSEISDQMRMLISQGDMKSTKIPEQQRLPSGQDDPKATTSKNGQISQRLTGGQDDPKATTSKNGQITQRLSGGQDDPKATTSKNGQISQRLTGGQDDPKATISRNDHISRCRQYVAGLRASSTKCKGLKAPEPEPEAAVSKSMVEPLPHAKESSPHIHPRTSSTKRGSSKANINKRSASEANISNRGAAATDDFNKPPSKKTKKRSASKAKSKTNVTPRVKTTTIFPDFDIPQPSKPKKRSAKARARLYPRSATNIPPPSKTNVHPQSSTNIPPTSKAKKPRKPTTDKPSKSNIPTKKSNIPTKKPTKPSKNSLYSRDSKIVSIRISKDGQLPKTKKQTTERIPPSRALMPPEVKFTEFQKQCLAEHNKYRELHKSPPLRLTTELNEYATEWAQHLARENYMSHRSPNEFGENIYRSKGMEPSAEVIVKAWYDEIKDYNFKKPDYDPKTAHFTQVVWVDSLELGVGIAKAEDGTVYVVCNYKPSGNIDPEFGLNVPPVGGFETIEIE